ncbi:LssY C-terminal domain-containing protein [Nitratireductor kimnyeongensis]|uniref:LssY C-terminal domain-containing protein n=1 Tax=Nitratireductor kimnyeongensis TaxID=430679 RepID=A0ABW0TE81_9HYPH|nr:LssY C-terminal domain-containing protein [Nitratireductor kimnyeongensis]QZZ36948.1 LssY C-terminal domain-containing protein [Nitratireductor kimnyeongensis]
MSPIIRWIQRAFVFLIASATMWLIATQVFERIDQRVPLFIALLITYVAAAYVILPIIVRVSAALLRSNRIPRVTRASDGLPADPVNIVLIGSKEQLLKAFSTIGWSPADRLSLRSAIQMATCFVLDRPYPTAPFSSLFLFGRRQDVGFQQCLGNSPRKRHHVRFWAANADPEFGPDDVAFWTRGPRIDPSTSHIWVGAGTNDTGFGLQSMTWQISHKVDRDADAEREHIVAQLLRSGCIEEHHFIEAGGHVATHFTTDGRIFHAQLSDIELRE